jgi:hypothetical protein
MIERGEYDEHSLPQAFARFEASLTKRDDELADALDRHAKQFGDAGLEHAMVAALRTAAARLRGTQDKPREPVIMKADRKTDAAALRTLADYIESGTYLKQGNKVSWSDHLEGVRRHYLDPDPQEDARLRGGERENIKQPAMSHDEALDALCGCARTVTVLSYQEAVEGYLELRGTTLRRFESSLAKGEDERELRLDYERRILAAEVDGVKAEKEMREAAARKATNFLVGDPANGIPLRAPMPHEIADAIRALPLKLDSEDAAALRAESQS